AAAVAELYRRVGKAKEAEEYERAAEMLPPDQAWANPYADPVAELRRGRAVLTDTYFVLERARDVDGGIATATALADQYPSVESQLLLLRAFVNTGNDKAGGRSGKRTWSSRTCWPPPAARPRRSPRRKRP